MRCKSSRLSKQASMTEITIRDATIGDLDHVFRVNIDLAF
jgi:hypothetical protein